MVLEDNLMAEKSRHCKPARDEAGESKVATRVYLSKPTSRRLKLLRAECDQPVSTIVEDILQGRRKPLSH